MLLQVLVLFNLVNFCTFWEKVPKNMKIFERNISEYKEI